MCVVVRHAASRHLKWKAFSLVTKWGRSPVLIAALLHPPLQPFLSLSFSLPVSLSLPFHYLALFFPWPTTVARPPPSLLSRSLSLVLVHMVYLPLLCFLFICNIPSLFSPVLSISSSFSLLKPLSSPSFQFPSGTSFSSSYHIYFLYITLALFSSPYLMSVSSSGMHLVSCTHTDTHTHFMLCYFHPMEVKKTYRSALYRSEMWLIVLTLFYIQSSLYTVDSHVLFWTAQHIQFEKINNYGSDIKVQSFCFKFYTFTSIYKELWGQAVG